MMTIGNDVNNKPIGLGNLVKREDGVIGRFEAKDFELIFRYEKEREDGAICSYVNLCSKEYGLLDV